MQPVCLAVAVFLQEKKVTVFCVFMQYDIRLVLEL